MEEIGEDQRRHHWRLLWLSAVQAFADSDIQRRRWTDPQERNPTYSYVECMCTYFDDAYMSEEDAFERRIASGHMSRQEADAIADFHAAADAYQPPNDNSHDVEAILADPAWQNVTRLAQACQKRLLGLLSAPGEIEALSDPQRWSETNGVFRADFTNSFIVPAGPPRGASLMGRVWDRLRKLRGG